MGLTRYWIFFIATIALALGGCASSSPSDDLDYSLSSINGQPVTDVEVTVRRSDGKLFGKGPLNNWQASLNDGRVGPIIMTRRAGPPHAMQLESQLMQVIEGAQLEERGEQWTFIKGEDRVVFTAVEQ